MADSNFESKLIEDLFEIENKFPVEKLAVDDIYIWPLLKVRLYLENLDVNNLKTGLATALPTSTSKKIVYALLFGLKFLFSDFNKHKFFGTFTTLIFADPFNRRVTHKGHKYEIYVDPIYDYLVQQKHKVLMVERYSTKEYPSPRHSPSFPQVILQIVFTLLAFRKRHTFDANSSDLIRQITQHLHSKGYATQTLGAKKSHQLLKMFFIHYKMYLFFYRYFGIKNIILSEWYSIASMAAITAAKRSHVRSVEVQHGVQTKYHIAYGHFSKAPKNLITPFPDVFWVWSRQDAVNIESEFQHLGCKSYLGGNLFFDQFMKNQLQLDGEAGLIEVLKQSSIKKNCLITLHTFYKLQPQIMEFIKNHQNDFFFLIRLHPLMDSKPADIHEQLLQHFPHLQFNVAEATELPLVVVLKHTDLHVTYNSSVIIEAEKFGIHSIIFETDLSPKYYKSQLDSGIAHYYTGHVDFKRISPTNETSEESEKLENLLIKSE